MTTHESTPRKSHSEVSDARALSSIETAISKSESGQIDLSILEIASSDKIEYAVAAAENVFKDAERSDRTLISGQEVSITNAFATEEINGQTYYVRLKKYYKGDGQTEATS